MKALFVLCSAALVTTGFAWNRHASNAEDEAAIRHAVEQYFEGMMQARPAALRTAFHSEARLIGTNREGGIMVIPFERWASSWEGRNPRDAHTHTNRILDVDIAGDAASVKTDLAWPNVHYVDYLSLLRVDGQWKIVNKIWTEEAP